MRRTIINNINIDTEQIEKYYIDRNSAGSYQVLDESSEEFDKSKLSDKYNDNSKYLYNKIYFEMPETFEDNIKTTITTNNGLVLIYREDKTCIIYDLFPSSFANKTLSPKDITLLNSQNTSSNFVIKNKQSYHSVVCKSDSVYLKPQCNIITSDYHGTIDMDLPAMFNCSKTEATEEDCNYCTHGLYKFTSSELDRFYIKAKPYLYISTGDPEMVTNNLDFITCSDNIYYIANITDQSYVEFKLKDTSEDASDCIVEFM